MSYRHAVFALALVVGLLPATALLRAESPPAKSYFPPDAAGTPPITLPDVLTAADGRKIATAEDWRKVRRPEVLELFRKYVYGRVPDTPYQTSFKVVQEDPGAMDGAATLKLVDVTLTNGPKSLTIHVVLFVPNKAPKPVPAFLLICNRPADANIDPT
ncbi:MAG: hypothetical protein NT049_08975, partial [Planctomycetota bacterium]|nr:hypothetical protein [Planctomycetota bacterium]